MNREDHWELLFTCPSCGFVSSFNANQLTTRQLATMQGSSWSKEVRDYAQHIHDEPHLLRDESRLSHLISVFVISLLTWIVLTGSLGFIDLLWGIMVSLVVASMSFRYVRFNLPQWVFTPRRWRYLFELVIEFGRQIIVQNITLSIRVLSPDLKIRPGIVAIPTRLRDDVSLTILGSLMSLTPDTVTLDIDQQNGIIYVHWIDVQTLDPLEAQRLISASLEDKIVKWLE